MNAPYDPAATMSVARPFEPEVAVAPDGYSLDNVASGASANRGDAAQKLQEAEGEAG